MNSLQIALIGIRLVAIYLVAQGISSTPNIFLFITMFDSSELYKAALSISGIGAILFSVIVGCVIWSYAPEMSKHLISSEVTTDNNPPLNINQFQSTVIALIGIYMIVVNVPYAITSIYQLTNSTGVNGDSALNTSILSKAIAVNLEVAFGMLLLAGSKVISRITTKFSHIGTN